MTRKASTPPLEVPQRSLVRYLTVIVVLGITLLTIPVVLDQDASLFLLTNQYVVMLGGAVLLARRFGGVRRLFSGLFHWRIGVMNWVIAVVAVPVVTIAVAAATGTYTPPAEGWLSLTTGYLYATFIWGALFINLGEEIFWVGLVQRNLTRRHGLLRGAALTVIPFTAMHIPITLAGVTSVKQAAINFGVLVGTAFVMRYILGRTDRVTGGSLLAAGVFHAGFNASGELSAVNGDWQYAVALAVLGTALLLTDVVRTRARAEQLYPQDSTLGGSQPATVAVTA